MNIAARELPETTANLADYSVTEGQQLDVPSVHPEPRSRARSFALPVYDNNSVLRISAFDRVK